MVNCTSVGMMSGPDPTGLPVAESLLERVGRVYDLVYAPEETPLVRAARLRGLPAVSGLGMLIHQAAAAFTLWTGLDAPVEVMRQAAERRLRGYA
jgi:shikimate 5-dehydrogenase